MLKDGWRCCCEKYFAKLRCEASEEFASHILFYKSCVFSYSGPFGLTRRYKNGFDFEVLA